MLVAAHDALALADGLSYSEFAKRNHLSILKSIEIVGEAASRLSEETKETHPPWSEIVGMRNRFMFTSGASSGIQYAMTFQF